MAEAERVAEEAVAHDVGRVQEPEVQIESSTSTLRERLGVLGKNTQRLCEVCTGSTNRHRLVGSCSFARPATGRGRSQCARTRPPTAGRRPHGVDDVGVARAELGAHAVGQVADLRGRPLVGADAVDGVDDKALLHGLLRAVDHPVVVGLQVTGAEDGLVAVDDVLLVGVLEGGARTAGTSGSPSPWRRGPGWRGRSRGEAVAPRAIAPSRVRCMVVVLLDGDVDTRHLGKGRAGGHEFPRPVRSDEPPPRRPHL